MFGTQNLPLFLTAALMLALTPGPDTLYILGRSLSQGRKAGVLSVLGVGSGLLCHTAAVAFGLSALLATSLVAFTAIKYAGGLYLIYLGFQALRAPHGLNTEGMHNATPRSGWWVYGQGMLTNLLNPKVSLFFLALLPQFVTPATKSGPVPFLFLGSLFVLIAVTWLLSLVALSASFGSWLRANPKAQTGMQRATGLLYIGLGLNLLRARARTAS